MTGKRLGAALGGSVALLCSVLALALDVTEGPGGKEVAEGLDGLSAVSYAVAGSTLAWARPRNPIGWLLLLVGLCEGVTDLATAVAQHPSTQPGTLQTGAAWLGSWVWFPVLALLPSVVLALYPTGRAGSRPRRWLVGSAGTGTLLVTLGFALVDDAVDDIVPGLANPFAVPPLGLLLAVCGAVLLVPSALLTILDAARRLWRAPSPEREQLGWLLVTVVLAVAIGSTPWDTVRAGAFVLVPVAIAVGILRHRLLDLQVVVRRTLLFTALTVLVVGVFVATTAALSGLVDGDGVPVAVSAALVALSLTPARDRLQLAVDRLVYGERRDPVRAVAGLGRDVVRHDDETLVPQVLSTVMAAVRSPHVVLLGPDATPVAEAGVAAGGTPLRLPLRVGGRGVGELCVTPRTPLDGWSRADLDLLDVLAPQVAVVVHAARLYDDLAESRDQVLRATTEERQRLRAELHDGLGPALSGIALGLEAAEVCLGSDPARAAALVARLREETQAAGREVGRLVDGLRPAALEERDLTAAVGAFLDGLSDTGAFELELDVPSPLPALSADVDGAAYRIVTEAVTNVVRHSGARWCRVHLADVGDRLSVTVEDDGYGLSTRPQAGVGLDSMRRRAAALGGTWSAQARHGGGTRIEAVLPLVGRPAVPV